MAPYTVLISGANRGIGKGLLELYLAQPNHTVIAFNRDPSSHTSRELFDLPRGAGSQVIVVKSDATVETDPFEAVKELEKQGVAHLDLVIANAAVAYTYPLIRELKIADLQAHLEPNVFGVITLYQATRDLLNKAEQPKWITIGSAAGWIVDQLEVTNAAYAPTKVAVHWVTKKIDQEEERIASWVIDPGFVQTDMGNKGARYFGMEQAPLPLHDSVNGIVKVLSVGTKETHGGKLWRYDGELEQW